MTSDSEHLGELTDFQAWASNSMTPITLLDYVGFVATPDLFFAFAGLFHPDLILHEGRPFLASGFGPAVYDSWKRKGLSAVEIQKILNHVHVCTLFQNQPIGDKMAVATGMALAEIWRRTLGESVRVETGGSALHDVYVTFFDVSSA